MTKFISNNNVKIRTITNLVGTLLIFLAGLFFVLIVDLKMSFKKANANAEGVSISVWLFLAIIFALGGGIFYFLGDSMKHKKFLTLFVKGIGIVLGIGYIVFLQVFKTKIVLGAGLIDVQQVLGCKIVLWATIFDILALVVLALNYVFSIIFLDEDY